MSNEFSGPTRVFISYAQFSEAHSARVLALAQALRGHGVDVELDQYHKNELLDWPRWCQEQLRADRSDWVLMVCSPTYRDRLENRVDPRTGKGVFWEGALIEDEIYNAKGNRRFVPILLDDEPEDSIPSIVRGWTCFRIRGVDHDDPGYERLYRLLTDQPDVVREPIGAPVDLRARPIKQIDGPTSRAKPAPNRDAEPEQRASGFRNETFYEEKSFSPRAILRQCLQDSFTDREDARAFCSDYCKEVYQDLSETTPLSGISIKIIDYYEVHGKEHDLWQWIRRRKASNYEKWFHKWEDAIRLRQDLGVDAPRSHGEDDVGEKVK